MKHIGLYYKLIDRNAVQCSHDEWFDFFLDKENCIVKQEYVFGRYGNRPIKAYVSTVFLGINHHISDDIPQLFETQIRHVPKVYWQERSATWEEALEKHQRALDYITKLIQSQ